MSSKAICSGTASSNCWKMNMGDTTAETGPLACCLSLSNNSASMDRIDDTTCMHDWPRSISKLCSRIDFLCVSCIDRIDQSEVLLKLVLGLKNLPIIAACI